MLEIIRACLVMALIAGAALLLISCAPARYLARCTFQYSLECT